jgi:hypothetical protein
MPIVSGRHIVWCCAASVGGRADETFKSVNGVLPFIDELTRSINDRLASFVGILASQEVALQRVPLRCQVVHAILGYEDGV